MNDLLDTIKQRRSIRKFTKQKVERETLLKIAEAGLYAPNAGGRQATKIILLDDFDTIEKIGIYNASCENRNWGGKTVNADQPSIIDDLSIRNGFYDCQALAIVCVNKQNYNAVNVIGSGFTTLENMVLEAYSLGVDSCIVGRAKATFENEEMAQLLKKWQLDEDYFPLMFLCLGYINGLYPKAKPRKDHRIMMID